MFENILTAILWLGGLGLFFGIVLALAAKKFAVKQDLNVALIREALPGANCGACGYAGCDELAKAISLGQVKANICPSMTLEKLARISELTGVDSGNVNRKKAVVMCGGIGEKSKRKFEYHGIDDCREAMIVMQGDKVCENGCMGFGTCAKVCVNNAITIDKEHGHAFIDESKCTGCGACEKACPKHIIQRVPVDAKVHVYCKSVKKGKEAKEICSASCISCGLCAKECPEGAITMVDNLPVIDYDKCINCEACTKKCPTKAIRTSE